MKNCPFDILIINGVNGAVLAVLNLAVVRDVVAILLGILSIISTIIIIRKNLKSKDQ